MNAPIVKQSVDDWLNQVDYNYLNNGTFVPSTFSLEFMNFIKLVNGKQGESSKTPVMHLAMLDNAINSSKDIVNLCFRGAAKTTLFMEYFSLFLGVFHFLPNFGEVDSMIYVSDSMDNGVKAARKNIEFRYEHSDFLQEWIPEATFTDQYIELINKQGQQFGVKMFGAKTGLRGTKIFGKRPPLAVLDDLISDEDGRSPTSLEAIKSTIYKAVDYALDPTRRRVIFNGTPFNKEDPIVEAVESGAWNVNVWPVCETFPCSREEFHGAWEDRFSYDYIKAQYDKAVLTGKLPAFYQELMLRISSDEERLVQDGEIRWFSRQAILQNRSAFNFYITTDFATTDKQTSDYSVISVWAYNSNGDWFWVDGIAEKQLMDKTINDLFRLAQEYRPQQVGIEISGQQGAFIKWIQQEQLNRNIWFTFASDKDSGKPGIHPITNKLARFNLVVPWFKMGKIYFPEEWRTSRVVGIFLDQIKLATQNGIKGKDDTIDTISQLAYLTPWKPSQDAGKYSTETNRWEPEEVDLETIPLSSYIV
ncbi:terminase large subunit [Rhizobium phage RHph_Y38]|uniref:Terminase large subunit protein n=2 Tax=Acanvirus TaxID=3044653 RepID=A0A7S5UU62_9CAUD|nr:terminase large subunit [Rhizobium phage RHph_Y38]YP_010658301.1 terminase large subunit [Rhizobium phage RHEph22]QIG67793.1 terminase large subunit protein [Rhizobium phage RHph_Y38]QXV74763.1 terminase large subunit protein [Rhizobium phage RHEph22]QXV74859.1 terminase large subunit protein [Rhizobium phage RHEph24]